MSAAATAIDNAPDKLVRVGLAIVGLVCIVVSGDVLVYVAQRAEWDGWRAYMLPVLIDLPGLLGGRIWLRRARTTPKTRNYARSLTLAALGVSILGNTVGHLVKAGYVSPGVALVIVTGCAAPLVLWAVLHLDALLTPAASPSPSAAIEDEGEAPAEVGSSQVEAAGPSQNDAPVPAAVPVPAELPSQDDRVLPGPPDPSQDEDGATEVSGVTGATDLTGATGAQDEDGPVDEVRLQRARHLDAAHRAEHGRHISRDKLASALRIGKGPASDLLRLLKAEAA